MKGQKGRVTEQRTAKCTDVTNRQFVLVSIFTVPHTDLIMHNYRSNQSALMTRCRTNFRHQYGIFCGESQTSFTQNATRAGSEEGRLFSQAKISASLLHFFINIKMFKLIECYRLIEKMGNGSKCNVMLALIEF